MTAYVVATAVLAFLAGVGVGYLLRDRYLRRKAATMPDLRRPSRFRTVLLVLVGIALLANASVGFLLIATRAALEEQRDRFENLVLCQEAYNRDQGEALEERDLVIKGTAESEILLWEEYLRISEIALAADPDDAELGRRLSVRFQQTVREWVEGLRETQQARRENPYPDPERCLEEARRRD